MDIKERNAQEANMKFDVIIGNPPYQEEAGGTSSSDKPLYHLFMQQSYKLSDKVMLITPGRFLFNAGATPSSWNKQMLADPHIKVMYYETVSEKVFPGTDIKGGVAITYRDASKNFRAIETFTVFPELNEIIQKVAPKLKESGALNEIIFTQNKFNLNVLNSDFPDIHRADKRLESNIFQLSAFTEEPQGKNDLKILGLIKNKRVYRYVNKKYIDLNSENLNKYKVILPKSNGSGNLGEVMSTPLIGTPLIGYTRTFIGIGAFDTQAEADAALKYVKSKFCRVMLGVLKVTQDNNPDKWRMVPLQDFTSQSDIDWSRSVADIDKQLYKKYGLDEKEINFIETKVKGME